MPWLDSRDRTDWRSAQPAVFQTRAMISAKTGCELIRNRDRVETGGHNVWNNFTLRQYDGERPRPKMIGKLSRSIAAHRHGLQRRVRANRDPASEQLEDRNAVALSLQKSSRRRLNQAHRQRGRKRFRWAARRFPLSQQFNSRSVAAVAIADGDHGSPLQFLFSPWQLAGKHRFGLLLAKASSFCESSSSDSARIAAARSAAFFAPASPIASVPTGIPPGICAVERSESSP